MKPRETVRTSIFIGTVLASMLAASTATAQISPLATFELFVYNSDDVSHTFDASSEGRVQWERNGSTFEVTTAYGEVDAITVTPGQSNGWDFVDAPGAATGNDTLAYSKYRIWTDDETEVWLDYRDTYYIADNFGGAGVDVHVYYDGSAWKFIKSGLGYDTVVVQDGGTVGIWTIIGRANPDQEGFKVPVTVQNNFSGGLVTVDGANQNSPYNSSWSLYTSHSFSAISPQTIGAANYVWCAWNDGGGQSRNVTVGEYSSSLSYTANFLGAYISGPGSLQKGESYTYDSNPPGGSGNRSYQ